MNTDAQLILQFASTQEGTISAARALFRAHRDFFVSRGIETDEQFVEIIRREFPLASHVFPNGELRRIEFSPGFYVNDIEKCMGGYATTMGADDPYSILQEKGCGTHTPGFAALFAISVDADVEGVVYLTEMEGAAKELEKHGLWTVTPSAASAAAAAAPVDTAAAASIHSCDRVITFMKDTHNDHVRYIYVRVRQTTHTSAKTVQQAALEHQNSLAGMSARVRTIITQLFERIFDGAEKTEPRIIWSTNFNVVARTQVAYTYYNHCYDNAFSKRLVVLMSPEDGFLHLLHDAPVQEEKYQHATTHQQFANYINDLASLKYSASSLAHLALVPTNMNALVRTQGKAGSAIAKFRSTRFFYYGGKSLGVDHAVEYETTLVYIAPTGSRTTLKPQTVVMQTPSHVPDHMSDAEFIEYFMRTGTQEVRVATKNLSRIIHVLSRLVLNNKEYDFRSVTKNGDFLLFSLEDIIEKEKKNSNK